ncbi:uncharacterized protein BXIN_2082 [Babesia sp. Xinjiang]|uniref:uncharacterized protein n=1 Tax=Babesia sp. Xinjiang TaxID=462227 RepID=UPI000A21CE78|nr:uncharacterized protein BXIN_2082 [Babesia sp. Xinjiang]ORM40415.1 hypothetical protein BXIN_2082 [Babesia sp. Xinjiang]
MFPQTTNKDLFDIVDANDTLETLKEDYERFKELLQDFEKGVLKEAIYDSLSGCKDVNEANVLLLIHEVIIGQGNRIAIPPVASLHDIYREAKVDPAASLTQYKRMLLL